MKWYRLAADQGYDRAQYDLGKCYHEGRGIENDMTEAVKWYRLAADQGDYAAKEALKELTPGE